MSEPESKGGDRLERALDVFLASTDRDAAAAEALLNQHGDLRDLLEPMLAGAAACATGSDGRVLGDYRLVRELGRGGMGIVYEAWQRSLDRRVALKVLTPAMVASPSAVARFRREAAATGRLRHPGIVEVFEFGSDGETHFFAMQLVDGAPLSERLSAYREPAAAIALAVQLVTALQHAHGAGLVHRDVKPANILVRADGTAVLTDFGLASDATLPTVTREGSFLGTLDYASPEQVRGEPVDERTDLWATGVLLFELLAGSHPFVADSQHATMQRILTAEPPSLQRARPGTSNDLAAVVAHLLEKDRARRYPSAAALLADLQALQQGEPVTARLASPRERLQRWARREPWRAAALLLLLLGLPSAAAGLGFYFAKAPVLALAEQQRVAEVREDALAAATLTWMEDGAAAALRQLEQLAPGAGDDEAPVLRAIILCDLGRKDEAAALLTAVATPQAAALRNSPPFVDAPAPRADAGIDPTWDATTCYGNAVAAMAYGRSHDDQNAYRLAARLMERALLLLPRPRAAYVYSLLLSASRSADANMVANARAALERHFGGRPFCKRALASVLPLFDPKTAIALCQQLLAESPSAMLQYALGLALAKDGQAAAAEQAYRACVALDAGNHQAWNNLGMLLHGRGSDVEAIAAYRQAVAVRPANARAWNNLGNALSATGDKQGALAAFDRALQEKKDYGVAAYNLGNVRRDLGDLPGAIAAYEQAIASDRTYYKALANLGVTLGMAGRWQEAYRTGERALLLAPDDPDQLHRLAVAACKCQLAERAVQTAQRACDLVPKRQEYWYALADALLLRPDTAREPRTLAAAKQADALARGRDGPSIVLCARAEAWAGQRQAAAARLDDLEQRTGSALPQDVASAIAAARAELAAMQ